MLLAVVDGLKGFPEAITAVFPEASVQTCIVHLIRHSLSYCRWKERAAVAAALKLIYRAESAGMAAQRLGEFEAGEWGRKYPTIAASPSASSGPSAGGGPGSKSSPSSPIRPR